MHIAKNNQNLLEDRLDESGGKDRGRWGGEKCGNLALTENKTYYGTIIPKTFWYLCWYR